MSRHPSQPSDHDKGGSQPQQALEAERSLLGAMLLSRDAVADVIDMLDWRSFHGPGHWYIFNAIVDLYRRGEPADPVTVIPELHHRGELLLAGGATYLHTLIATVPDASQAKYYAQLVSSGERP